MWPAASTFPSLPDRGIAGPGQWVEDRRALGRGISTRTRLRAKPWQGTRDHAEPKDGVPHPSVETALDCAQVDLVRKRRMEPSGAGMQGIQAARVSMPIQ